LSLILDNADLYDASASHNGKLASIWNIFYHFFISNEDLALVREQSSRLLSCSESTEKWEESPYSLIKFVSLQTIEEVRKIWTKYAEVKTAPNQQRYDTARRLEIKKVYDGTYGKGGTSTTLYAGTHWEKGLPTMNRGLRGYWSTGVAGGIEADVAALGSNRMGLSNPLFMVCSLSETFIVHYTSVCILSEFLLSQHNVSQTVRYWK